MPGVDPNFKGIMRQVGKSLFFMYQISTIQRRRRVLSWFEWMPSELQDITTMPGVDPDSKGIMRQVGRAQALCECSVYASASVNASRMQYSTTEAASSKIAQDVDMAQPLLLLQVRRLLQRRPEDRPSAQVLLMDRLFQARNTTTQVWQPNR
jgi:hypothetical protein